MPIGNMYLVAALGTFKLTLLAHSLTSCT